MRWPCSAAWRPTATASIVLPTPGGPISKRLPCSSTKRNVASSLDERGSRPGLGVVVDVGERDLGGEAREPDSLFEPAPFGRFDLGGE
jgi:hypothetical protein